jgi:hypothetical protein
MNALGFWLRVVVAVLGDHIDNSSDSNAVPEELIDEDDEFDMARVSTTSGLIL